MPSLALIDFVNSAKLKPKRMYTATLIREVDLSVAYGSARLGLFL